MWAIFWALMFIVVGTILATIATNRLGLTAPGKCDCGTSDVKQ